MQLALDMCVRVAGGGRVSTRGTVPPTTAAVTVVGAPAGPLATVVWAWQVAG